MLYRDVLGEIRNLVPGSGILFEDAMVFAEYSGNRKKE